MRRILRGSSHFLTGACYTACAFIIFMLIAGVVLGLGNAIIEHFGVIVGVVLMIANSWLIRDLAIIWVALIVMRVIQGVVLDTLALNRKRAEEERAGQRPR